MVHQLWVQQLQAVQENTCHRQYMAIMHPKELRVTTVIRVQPQNAAVAHGTQLPTAIVPPAMAQWPMLPQQLQQGELHGSVNQPV
jgi:hypothetical protein